MRDALIDIPSIGRFKALKNDRIHMRCQRCKATRSNMPRTPYDLEGAAVMVTNYCPRCDKGGDFEDCRYFTIKGEEIQP